MGAVGGGFHVACAYSGRLVCRCRAGEPAGEDPARMAARGLAAAKLWELLFGRAPGAKRGAGDGGSPGAKLAAAAGGGGGPAVEALMGEEAEIVLPVPKRFRPVLVRSTEGWTLKEMADVAGNAGAAALVPLMRGDGKHNISRARLEDLRKRMEAKRATAATLEAKAQAAEKVAADGRAALEVALAEGRAALAEAGIASLPEDASPAAETAATAAVPALDQGPVVGEKRGRAEISPPKPETSGSKGGEEGGAAGGDSSDNDGGSSSPEDSSSSSEFSSDEE